MTVNNLGLAYADRIQGDRAENLERAIHYYRQALQVRTKETHATDWALTMMNLGIAYTERIKSRPEMNMEKAIRAFQRALTVLTQKKWPYDWALVNNNMADAYLKRIKGEQAENIEIAIESCQRALSVRTKSAMPAAWAMTMVNLGNAYLKRIHGDMETNLEMAIQAYEQALTAQSRKTFPNAWARLCVNLAMVYRKRTKGNPKENQERAIQLYRKAMLVITPKTLPRSWANANLAFSLAYKNRISGRRSRNIKRAKELNQNAMTVFNQESAPFQWAACMQNYGTIFVIQARGKIKRHLQEALTFLKQSLKVFMPNKHPTKCLEVYKLLGMIYMTLKQWSDSHHAFMEAINAGYNSLIESFTDTGRRTVFSETSYFYSYAAFCLVKCKKYREALLLLESGKSRFLIEALRLHELIVAKIPDGTRGEIAKRRKRQQMLNWEMTSTDSPQRRRVLAEDLEENQKALFTTLKHIRNKYPKTRSSEMSLSDLLILIPKGGAIIAPMITNQGCFVFVLPHGAKDINARHVLELPNFTDNYINLYLRGSQEAGWPGWLASLKTFESRSIHTRGNLGQMGASKIPEVPLSATGGSSKSLPGSLDHFGTILGNKVERLTRFKETLLTIGTNIWHYFMGPLHHFLADMNIKPGSHLVMLPQGGLGAFPLHAAWHGKKGEEKYFLDDYTLSYAPGAFALDFGRRRLNKIMKKKPSLLAIINPEDNLPHAESEGETIAKLFARDTVQELRHHKATSKSILLKLPRATYLHFACHGFHNQQNPTLSGIRLARNQSATLGDFISKWDLSQVRLVVLSACETLVTEALVSPDEFVGLPAGILQAGASGVIGSLWPVEDLSTALLMGRFYIFLLQEGDEPAHALRKAQFWLRDITVGELLRSDKTWFISQTFKNNLALRFGFHEDDERPFAHTYFWSAFGFFGI